MLNNKKPNRETDQARDKQRYSYKMETEVSYNHVVLTKDGFEVSDNSFSDFWAKLIAQYSKKMGSQIIDVVNGLLKVLSK